ncbi:hypothetical protein MKW92_029566 [Papaver armeniacum]|nr:hypothetical protein MKW92_029566 [Papaver armeniacum]
MELAEKTQNQEIPIQDTLSTKDGLKTLPFIIVNEAFEKVASYGIQPNLILYLINEYHYSSATGVTILSMWSASSNFLAIFEAFLSDSYLGRFRIIALGSIASFLVKPKPCDLSLNVCESATPAQFIFLLSSLGLMSIGAGCIRPCSIACGADQHLTETYFNFYYATIGFSTLLALTVYMQDQMGWQVGFAVPAVLMLLSALFSFLGNSFYIKVKSSTSLFTGFAKVSVAAWRNGRLDLYLKPDGSPTKPWELCAVSQVETLESLIRVIPIWSTGFMIYMTLSQNSIPHFMIPILAKYTGKPNGIRATIRMGIGLLLSFIALAVAGIVEPFAEEIQLKITSPYQHYG